MIVHLPYYCKLFKKKLQMTFCTSKIWTKYIFHINVCRYLVFKRFENGFNIKYCLALLKVSFLLENTRMEIICHTHWHFSGNVTNKMRYEMKHDLNLILLVFVWALRKAVFFSSNINILYGTMYPLKKILFNVKIKLIHGLLPGQPQLFKSWNLS